MSYYLYFLGGLKVRKYFYKKEYIYLYLSKFCYSLANSFIDIFGVVMLYKNGMPLHQILLLYGIRFGIMGILSPLFITISSRFGIAMCSLIANILRVVSTYIILNGDYSNITFFIFAMSLPGALSNPIEDSVSNKYVESKYRGRYNSFRNISRILGATLASCLVGYGVLSQNNNILFIIITIFFILDYIFTKLVDYKPIKNNKNVLKETLRYIIKSRNNYKIIYSLRTFHIIERLFVPLYIFLVLKDFKNFTFVMIASLSLQIVTVFIIGKYTDKNIVKSNTLVSFIRMVITSLYLILNSKLLISINKTISDNFEKVYETSIQTSIQNIIKNSNEDYNLLSTVGQMSLCFTEVIIFTILSILSIFIEEKIFYIIFILSIFSTIEINFYIKKENLQK